MVFTLPETVGVYASALVRIFGSSRLDSFIPVTMAEGPHPFPFRTRPLSPPAPMVLSGRPGGRVGRCRDFSSSSLQAPVRWDRGFFFGAFPTPVIDSPQ